MDNLILTRQNDYIFEIVLNRPDKRNALNLGIMQEFDAAIQEAEKAEGARAILIRGEGRAFSAGIDVTGMPEMAAHFGIDMSKNLFPVTRYLQGIFNRLENCALPSIALLHGHCLGMGFELALACDFRIVAEGTQLGLPETRLGLIPDVGGTTRLVRLAGFGRAKELIITGRRFGPDEAERWGLANEVVSEDTLVKHGEWLAQEIAASAPLAVAHAKRVINGIQDLDRGLQMEAFAQAQLVGTKDFQNAAQAMLTREPVTWQGE